LGVDANPEHIRAELQEVTHQLAQLSSAVFLDVGAGPGVFEPLLPGRGFALDQSKSALSRPRIEVAGVPVIRGDATTLPIADKAVARVFAGHPTATWRNGNEWPFSPKLAASATNL
jgi:SAM-dependent methyltransferase